MVDSKNVFSLVKLKNLHDARIISKRLLQRHNDASNIYTSFVNLIISKVPSLIRTNYHYNLMAEEEYLRQFYKRKEYKENIVELSSFYRFHQEIPRYAQATFYRVIDDFHGRRRKALYCRVKGIVGSENIVGFKDETDSHNVIKKQSGEYIPFLPLWIEDSDRRISPKEFLLLDIIQQLESLDPKVLLISPDQLLNPKEPTKPQDIKASKPCIASNKSQLSAIGLRPEFARESRKLTKCTSLKQISTPAPAIRGSTNIKLTMLKPSILEPLPKSVQLNFEGRLFVLEKKKKRRRNEREGDKNKYRFRVR